MSEEHSPREVALRLRLAETAKPICGKVHHVNSCYLIRTPRTYERYRGGWVWSFVCVACGFTQEFVDYACNDVREP